MTIVTTSFDRADQEQDWDQVNVTGLHEEIVEVLGRHFDSFDQAAAAQSEYERTMREVDASAPHLFSAFEMARAGLAAHPPARQWQSFMRAACEAVAPFSFAVRFSQIGENPTNHNVRGNDHGGQQTGIQSPGPH